MSAFKTGKVGSAQGLNDGEEKVLAAVSEEKVLLDETNPDSV